MKKLETISLFFVVLLLISIAAGCIEGSDHTANQTTIENRTGLAVSIALNNSTVQPYLGGPWEIQEVNPHGYVTIAPGDNGEVTIETTNVLIGTETCVLHVYVDVNNSTVADIWAQPKRVPIPPST